MGDEKTLASSDVLRVVGAVHFLDKGLEVLSSDVGGGLGLVVRHLEVLREEGEGYRGSVDIFGAEGGGDSGSIGKLKWECYGDLLFLFLERVDFVDDGELDGDFEFRFFDVDD